MHRISEPEQYHLGHPNRNLRQETFSRVMDPDQYKKPIDWQEKIAGVFFSYYNFCLKYMVKMNYSTNF